MADYNGSQNEKSREVINEIQGAYNVGIDRGKKGGDFSSINVKVSVDVSEALTGLKAIQRESRKATQELRELQAEQERKSSIYTNGNGEEVYAEWTQKGDEVSGSNCVKIADILENIPTEKLVHELEDRTGVKTKYIKPHGETASLSVQGEHEGYTDKIEGPALVLVVTE